MQIASIQTNGISKRFVASIASANTRGRLAISKRRISSKVDLRSMTVGWMDAPAVTQRRVRDCGAWLLLCAFNEPDEMRVGMHVQKSERRIPSVGFGASVCVASDTLTEPRTDSSDAIGGGGGGRNVQSNARILVVQIPVYFAVSGCPHTTSASGPSYLSSCRTQIGGQRPRPPNIAKGGQTNYLLLEHIWTDVTRR